MNRTYTLQGEQDAVVLNHKAESFFATVGTWLVDSSSAEYSLEFTLDDVLDESIEPRWYTHPSVPVGTNANTVVYLNNHVRAIRLNIGSIVGSLEFKVLQGIGSV